MPDDKVDRPNDSERRNDYDRTRTKQERREVKRLILHRGD